jgi:SAM-dependent methyltransferase
VKPPEVTHILPPVSAGTTDLSAPRKDAVRRFWERRPCGSKHAEAPEGTQEFFDQVERSRDELEPFIGRYARFETTAGQRVLEIGTGLGTDLVKFARAGARVTGVDRTEHAISLVQARLSLEGLSGELHVGDAERLPFPDHAFDVVYSWGVLHHTPDMERAVAEALRVLRPGGRICAMFYARRSWVGLALWVRYALLAGRPMHSLSDVIAEHMESPGTRTVTRREAENMFGALSDLTIHPQSTPYDRRVAGPLVALTGDRMGWFMVIEGVKPG